MTSQHLLSLHPLLKARTDGERCPGSLDPPQKVSMLYAIFTGVRAFAPSQIKTTDPGYAWAPRRSFPGNTTFISNHDNSFCRVNPVTTGKNNSSAYWTEDNCWYSVRHSPIVRCQHFFKSARTLPLFSCHCCSHNTPKNFGQCQQSLAALQFPPLFAAPDDIRCYGMPRSPGVLILTPGSHLAGRQLLDTQGIESSQNSNDVP